MSGWTGERVSVRYDEKLLDAVDAEVGEDEEFPNRSEALRAAARAMFADDGNGEEAGSR